MNVRITWTQTQYRAVGAPTTVHLEVDGPFGTQTLPSLTLTDAQIGGPAWTNEMLIAAVTTALKATYGGDYAVTLASEPPADPEPLIDTPVNPPAPV